MLIFNKKYLFSFIFRTLKDKAIFHQRIFVKNSKYYISFFFESNIIIYKSFNLIFI
jgi:hypothetical protein